MSLLTPKEVAAELRVTPDTVYGYLRSGRLRGLRLGGSGSWRVRPEDVEEFLAAPPAPRAPRPRPVTGTVMRHVRGLPREGARNA